MKFMLPDGEAGSSKETWTLVQNPNNQDVRVRITYLFRTPLPGETSFEETIPANSRRTYNLSDKVPDGRSSVIVESLSTGKKVMLERAVYWNNRCAGTDTIGGYSDS